MAKPLFKASRTVACGADGSETLVVDLDAVIAGSRVSDDLSRVAVRAQEDSYELVHADWLRTCQIDHCIQWLRFGDRGQLCRHVVRYNRLHLRWWQPNGLTVGPRIGNRPHELEELRRTHNRIMNL